MRRAILFLTLVINVLTVYTQSTKPDLVNLLFQSERDNSIYKLYTEDLIITILVYERHPTKVVMIDSMNYGFYYDCSPPNMDSLQQDSVNVRYFEFTTNDCDDDGNFISNIECVQMKLVDDRMLLLYSSRQQYVWYKRVECLSLKVEKHLQDNNLQLYNKYLERMYMISE